mmetsp:Transcript_13176/g.19682  ORF Transcript_13176/g.19682 Transcript_13176/m.19682 type:complete len:288 (-) Transcript_13176:215-1078(-)
MLAGRVAIVTGGASGIGRAISVRLSQLGARVAVADLNETKGNALVEELKGDSGRTAMFVRTDTSKDESVESMVSAVGEEFGRIDILVNNAAAFVFGHLIEEGQGSGTGTDRNVSIEDWEKVLETNVVGYARCISNVVPWLRRNPPSDVKYENDHGFGKTEIDAGSRGSIVNVASVSGMIAQPEFVPYNASKAAIINMTKCTALDLAHYKIRVNSVSPGTVDTQAAYNHMQLIGLGIEEGKRVFSDGPLLKRQAAPQEIAHGVAFLASDQSSFMTGANLVIDGGQTIS